MPGKKMREYLIPVPDTPSSSVKMSPQPFPIRPPSSQCFPLCQNPCLFFSRKIRTHSFVRATMVFLLTVRSFSLWNCDFLLTVQPVPQKGRMFFEKDAENLFATIFTFLLSMHCGIFTFQVLLFTFLLSDVKIILYFFIFL